MESPLFQLPRKAFRPNNNDAAFVLARISNSMACVLVKRETEMIALMNLKHALESQRSEGKIDMSISPVLTQKENFPARIALVQQRQQPTATLKKERLIMPQMKKKVKVRDQQPARDPKGGRRPRHAPQSGGAGGFEQTSPIPGAPGYPGHPVQ
jgi:hypothetical protein